MCVCTSEDALTYIHDTYMPTYIYKYIHTYTHTCAHIHTHARMTHSRIHSNHTHTYHVFLKLTAQIVASSQSLYVLTCCQNIEFSISRSRYNPPNLGSVPSIMSYYNILFFSANADQSDAGVANIGTGRNHLPGIWFSGSAAGHDSLFNGYDCSQSTPVYCTLRHDSYNYK